MIGVALVRETGFLHQLAAERVIHHLQLGTELVEPPEENKHSHFCGFDATSIL